MATKKTILVLIAKLEIAYGKEVSDDAAALYAEVLADIDDVVLKSAVMEHIGANKWFPKVSDLRERARELGSSSHPSLLEESLEKAKWESWNKLSERKLALKDLWVHEQIFVPVDWDTLIKEFKAQERYSGAEALEEHKQYIMAEAR